MAAAEMSTKPERAVVTIWMINDTSVNQCSVAPLARRLENRPSVAGSISLESIQDHRKGPFGEVAVPPRGGSALVAAVGGPR